MPTNVNYEYFKAEERYHKARTLEERIAATEELIRAAPKHKGAERLLKSLKQRLAKLRMELDERHERKVGRGGGQSFAIKKEGAAQVALVGLPNSGKSKLLSELTSARTEVADYPFTTREPVPGMMQFEDVQIQLVEVPAIVEGSSLGKGLGARPLSVARNADAIALVVDLSADPVSQVRILVDELEAAGVRLNRKPPKVTIQRRSSGGIEIRGVGMMEGGEEEAKRILLDHRISNAFVVMEEQVTIEQFMEALSESNVYLRAFVILTKLDSANAAKIARLKNEFGGEMKFVRGNEPVEKLKRSIYEDMELIRVYTKRPDEAPAKRPIAVPRDSTVLDVARSVHKDFERGLKFARVWGSAKFPGQQVPRDYVLHDRDIVELHI